MIRIFDCFVFIVCYLYKGNSVLLSCFTYVYIIIAAVLEGVTQGSAFVVLITNIH